MALEKFEGKEWVYVVSAHLDKTEAVTKLHRLRQTIDEMFTASVDSSTPVTFDEKKAEVLDLNPKIKNECEMTNWDWLIYYTIEKIEIS